MGPDNIKYMQTVCKNCDVTYPPDIYKDDGYCCIMCKENEALKKWQREALKYLKIFPHIKDLEHLQSLIQQSEE